MTLLESKEVDESSQFDSLTAFIEDWNKLIDNNQPIPEHFRQQYNKHASNKDIFLVRIKYKDKGYKIQDYSEIAKDINLEELFINTGKAGFYSAVKNWKKLLKKIRCIKWKNENYTYFRNWRIKGSIISRKGPTAQWTIFEKVTEKVESKERYL